MLRSRLTLPGSLLIVFLAFDVAVGTAFAQFNPLTGGATVTATTARPPVLAQCSSTGDILLTLAGTSVTYPGLFGPGPLVTITLTYSGPLMNAFASGVLLTNGTVTNNGGVTATFANFSFIQGPINFGFSMQGNKLEILMLIPSGTTLGFVGPTGQQATILVRGVRLSVASGDITASVSTQPATNFPLSAFSNPLQVGGTGVRPTPNPGGTVNAASFSPGSSLTPGGQGSVFGVNLACFTELAQFLPLPTTRGNASVTLDGFAAPIFFASSSQINFQVPWELAGRQQAALIVTVNGVSSNPVAVGLASFGPGLFTTNQQGTGQGAILVAGSGGRLAGPGRPVNRTESIEVFCTGLGSVTNLPATGLASRSNPLSTTTTVPDVSVGGIPATVTFSGLAPGFVGLYQVNVKMPLNAPTGTAVPVVLRIDGVTSNTATIAVQ